VIFVDLPTRPFYPAIAGNLKQLPVAFISNNCRKLPVFCEIAGFSCRKFLYIPDLHGSKLSRGMQRSLPQKVPPNLC
jgi:hypothetical protein